MNTRLLLLPLLLLALSSCKDKNMNATNERHIRPLVTDAERIRTEMSGGFKPLEATVNAEGQLVLSVETRWDCPNGHPDFTLLWDGRVRKSMPPIATLRLVHNADDPCTGTQREGQLFFDLSPLDKHRSGGNPVIVRLQAFNASLAYPRREEGE